jgi:bifunctional DNA-binding transcriptional regulator/antitoxin component of YhaV-PrlF toxin-antitoxin module
MPIKVERTLFRVGEGSLGITLPKGWIIYNQLKPGDTVELIVNDGVHILVKEKPGASGDTKR